MEEVIIMMVLTVLLPIVPASILYKFLPSRATVKGPFKGLTIQLKGAFGAYFIVLLFLGGYFLTVSHQAQKYELWTVEGTLQLQEGGFDNRDVIIAIAPPRQHLLLNGKFLIENVPLPKQLGTNKPSLLIEKHGYDGTAVYLDDKKPEISGFPDYNIQYQPEKKNILIGNPIVLKRTTDRGLTDSTYS
jgi:hypothetical protein